MLAYHCLAKVNLSLFITGKQGDKHCLHSLMVPLEFGDTLILEGSGKKQHSLAWQQDGGVPQTPPQDNLVLKAAELFGQTHKHSEFFHFQLRKRIPLESGLGGGSSNAAATLLALNSFCGKPLGAKELKALAIRLGSDCPFFLCESPTIVSGIGEQVRPLPPHTFPFLASLRVLLFKPSFGISTRQTFSHFDQKTEHGLYTPLASAQGRLKAWIDQPSSDTLPWGNDLEPVVFAKYPALPCLLQLFKQKGIKCQMSGSGSACFALLKPQDNAEECLKLLDNQLGRESFRCLTRMALPHC